MFHDPLAACTAINKNICRFEEVEPFYESGQWGSIKKENTNTFISIDVDRDLFEKVLTGRS